MLCLCLSTELEYNTVACSDKRDRLENQQEVSDQWLPLCLIFSLLSSGHFIFAGNNFCTFAVPVCEP